MRQGLPAPLYRDPLFYLALLAGPAVWLVLYLLAPVPVAWNKPLLDPVWFLKLVLVYPVLEEIVFRGLLQELVRDLLTKAMFGPLTVANLLTSVLFAGAHFFYHPPLAAALVFFPSLVFGFFKERTGSLVAPVLLHAFYNAGYLWLFARPV
jgi:membrane protease YdiL (CAAX protease family)